MNIGRICQHDVDFADPFESVFQAAERMRQRTVGALVVLGPNKRPVGIVTDRDLVTRVIAGCKDPFAETVDSVMSKNVHVVTQGTSIEDALSLMRSAKVRRLPVVDHESRLVGIITLDDILLLLCEETAAIREVLKSQTPVAAAQESAVRRPARA